MKHLFTYVFLISSGLLTAQNFSFEDIEDRLSGFPGTSSANELAAHADLVNLSDSEFVMKCKREIISIPEGATESFCWGGQCYEEGVEVSFFTDLLEVDETIVSQGVEGFSGYYHYNGNLGQAEIKYTFFEDGNESNSISLTVYFCVDTSSICEAYLGSTEITKEPVLSDAAPNPASGNVILSYDFSALQGNNSILISSAVGKEIEKIDLNNRVGVLAFSVADYAEGMYFYSLVSDNVVVQTKRLMVNH